MFIRKNQVYPEIMPSAPRLKNPRIDLIKSENKEIIETGVGKCFELWPEPKIELELHIFKPEPTEDKIEDKDEIKDEDENEVEIQEERCRCLIL